MRREPDTNVVGGELLPCSAEPEFLAFSRASGNDLSTPRPVWALTVVAVASEEV